MISFEEETHTYRDEHGNIVPGVTRILKPLEDFEHVPQDVLAAAADLGTKVHKAVEWHIAGTLDWKSLDPHLAPYVKAADKWLAQVKPDILATELLLHNDKLGYAGLADIVFQYRKRKRYYLAIGDWKTSVTLPKTVGPQTAAYAGAYELMHDLSAKVERTCILLKPNGEPKDYPQRDRDVDDIVFRSCLNVFNFKFPNRLQNRSAA
jgi:hypothetical protein